MLEGRVEFRHVGGPYPVFLSARQVRANQPYALTRTVGLAP